MKIKTLLPLSLFASSATLMAVIDYGDTGSNYTQDFNSLDSSGTPSWTNDSTIAGWYASIGGTTPTTYNTSDGSASFQGRLISAGSSGGSDRTFAYMQKSPSDGVNIIGAAFANTTGSELSAFSLSYNGEQWRYIGSESATVMSFEYQIFSAGTGSLTEASGWTSASSLDFTSPETGSSSSSVDGNVAGRVSISDTISSITWQNNEELWIRWSVSGATYRAMLGVDDVVFSATSTIPEVSSYATIFGFISFASILVLRRRDASRRD